MISESINNTTTTTITTYENQYNVLHKSIEKVLLDMFDLAKKSDDGNSGNKVTRASDDALLTNILTPFIKANIN